MERYGTYGFVVSTPHLAAQCHDLDGFLFGLLLSLLLWQGERSPEPTGTTGTPRPRLPAPQVLHPRHRRRNRIPNHSPHHTVLQRNRRAPEAGLEKLRVCVLICCPTMVALQF